MKIIVYFLVAVFIYGIVALSFTNKTHSSGSILIQSVDKNISLNSLTTSAKIISDRLKSFSPENFDVSVIPERNQIEVSLAGNWDLNIVMSLVLQKGELSFYESYNQSEEQVALLTGNDVESITANHDKTTHENYLEVRFKKSAIDKWTNATKRNINRAIVIVVDNHVIYDPVLKSEISNGICTITGNFTETEIRLLASTVSHGELPAEFFLVK